MEIQSYCAKADIGVSSKGNLNEEMNRAYQVLLSIVENQKTTIKDLESQRSTHLIDLTTVESLELFDDIKESRLLQIIQTKLNSSSDTKEKDQEIVNIVDFIREFVPGKMWQVDTADSTDSGNDSLHINEFVPGQKWKVR